MKYFARAAQAAPIVVLLPTRPRAISSSTSLSQMALFGVSALALSLVFTAPLHAEATGGAGGTVSGFGSGGAPGEAGQAGEGAGGSGGTAGTSGAPDAGVGSDVAAGSNGGGGGGGYSNVVTTDITADMFGGNGGDGGDGDFGGGGGAGGDGAQISGTVTNVDADVTGGNGGDGGSGTDAYGGGGGGGAGIVLQSGQLNIQANHAIQGGAGGASDQGGGGGGGGAGVVIQGVGRVLDLGFNGSITGGDGGAGGTTALGGNGGAGVVSDAFTTITIDGTVKGGNGQGAGSGGAGLDLRHGGTVRNFGDIVGGDGGAGAVAVPPGVVAGGTGSGGAAGMRPEFVGSSQGGAGVVGANLTISTGGLIAGGSSAFGQANAISFIGGDNRLELLGGYTFIGNVVVDTAAGATGTLVLDSPSSLSSDNFDVDAFGTTFQGFTAVEKTGGGQWDLTSSSGTGSLSGPVAVKGGRLRAQADNVFGSTSAFTLTGVGVLDASDFDNTIGSLAGTGGGLQIGNGTISVGADNTSTEFAGEIFNLTPGLGTFRKIGVGTLTLTGNSSSFTGTANVVGGKLVVGVGGAGQLGGTLLVENGGALGGTGSVGATTIFAGGTHAPGNSIGTQTVNGNYINSGVLEIEAGPTSADQIIVNGTVDITGATLDLLLSPGAVSNWGGPFIVIANDGGDAVIGAFDPVTENLLFLDPSLDYAGGDGNDVSLDLVRNNVQFADVAKTANQRAVAGSIDTMSGGPIVGSLISQTDADLVRASYDALSGEIHASLQSGLINNGLMLGNAADSRLRAAFDFAGADAAPVLAYGRDGTRLALPNTNLAAAWGTAYGAWGTIESDGNAASLDTSSGGLVAGIDGRLGGWRLGFLASYGQSDFSADARSSSADSDNYAFGLYGGTKWGNLAFRSGLTASWHDIDTDRTVTLPGLTDQPSASYDANSILAFGELGYRLELTNTAMIGPFANFTHVHLSTDDFTETGGFAALTGSEASTDTSFTTIGLRASNQFAMGAMLGTVHAMAGWRHGFGDLTPTSSLAFVAGGDAFAISGVPLAENTALLQAGIDLSLSETATFGINYDGRFAKETNVNAVSANLTVAF